MKNRFNILNGRSVCIFLTVAVLVGMSNLAVAARDTSQQKLAVTIDTDKTGEPISKYIYGQFIEQLGRCVYGGIWAEMIEDRKFFYPVGDDKSPWKPIAPPYTITMVRWNSYVGDHTPHINLDIQTPHGVTQAGLALRRNKSYNGRIILAGSPSAKIKVSLVWGPRPNERQTISINSLTPEYTKTTLGFTAGADTDNGRLEITGLGKEAFQIGAVSLMPADNVRGMRADTLKLLKELNSPIYRWPGGNFVSGYDWRNGVGNPDKRPPLKNPAWRGIEHNDFGIDEFIAFCRELNAEPFIAVNTGFGDAHSAAQEVEYTNGSPDTPMGRWRAANGHPEPYNVKFWSVGNEMYGKWQLGYMAQHHYVIKHNLCAEAMRKVDPSVKLIAVGATTDEMISIGKHGDGGDWSEGMLKNCAEHMDLISEHFYCPEPQFRHRSQGQELHAIDHFRQPKDKVRLKVNAHRNYRKRLKSLKGKDIRIALDEWNYWYGPYLYGELGTRYFLKDALGIAAGLHEIIRSSDIIVIANYAQTVNVIGCIKTTKTEAAFATTGLPLKLYRNHFGVIPVDVTGGFEPLDVVAAWTDDRKALTVAIVNPTERNLDLALDLKAATLSGKGRRWCITGPGEMAYNEPGKEPQVAIEETPLTGVSDKLSVLPLSINLYELPVR